MLRLILIVSLLVLLSGRAFAFHDRGVASCSGCHTMHNSQDGVSIDLNDPSGNPWLLIAASPSDVCLSCHANSFGSVLGSSPLAPPPEKGAGNFVFLLEDNINDGPNGASNPIPGSAAGHNINAPAHGLATDGTSPVSPGGAFPSNRMECTSCHDPHGNQNFRLLYGAGPIMGGLYSFTDGPLLADGIDLVTGAETNSNHTAYKSKVMDWCANCHGNFHEHPHNVPFKHPAGKRLASGAVRQYDRYNGTSDPTGGTHATAYLAAVPFEDATVTTTSTVGPTVSSNVMCLTCHRAHATSAPHAGRWDFYVDLLSNDGVISGSYPIPNPYKDPAQKKLCYKCHVSGME